MNRFGWPLLAALTCVAGAAHAAENFCGRARPHPIDVAFAAASERSGGVTVDLVDAQSAAYDAWDKELNRVYAELQKVLPAEKRDALRTAQRAWLAFDAAQAKWEMVLHADQGTSTALNVGGAALERRRSRVCDLDDTLQGLRDE